MFLFVVTVSLGCLPESDSYFLVVTKWRSSDVILFQQLYDFKMNLSWKIKLHSAVSNLIGLRS